jgi:hypothetical protein
VAHRAELLQISAEQLQEGALCLLWLEAFPLRWELEVSWNLNRRVRSQSLGSTSSKEMKETGDQSRLLGNGGLTGISCSRTM